MSHVRDLLPEYFSHFASFPRGVKLLLGSNLLLAVSGSIQMVLLNLYLLAAGHDKDVLGTFTAVSNLVVAAAAVPVGVLADRMGRRAAMIHGSLLTCLGAGAVLLASGEPGLYAAVAVVAVGQAAVGVVDTAYVADQVRPDQRTHAFSMMMMTWAGLGVAGTVAGGYLPGWYAGLAGVAPDSAAAYRAGLWVAVALLAAAALLRLPIPRGEAISPTARAGFNFSSLRHWLEIRRLTVLTLVAGAGAGVIFPFFNVFFKERAGMDAAGIGQVFAVGNLIGIAGTLVAPRVARIHGKVAAATVLRLAAVPVLVVMAFAGAVPVLVGAFLARASLIWVSNPIIDSFAMDSVDSEERATLASLQFTAWCLGWAAAAKAAGMVMGPYGFAPILLASAAGYAVYATLLYAWFKESKRYGLS